MCWAGGRFPRSQERNAWYVARRDRTNVTFRVVSTRRAVTRVISAKSRHDNLDLLTLKEIASWKLRRRIIRIVGSSLLRRQMVVGRSSEGWSADEQRGRGWSQTDEHGLTLGRIKTAGF